MQDRIVFQHKSKWKTREIEPSEVPYEVSFFTEKTTIFKFWLLRMLPPHKKQTNRHLSIALTFREHRNLAF